MANKEINENYKHVCDSTLINPSEHIRSISLAGYSDEEFKSIMDFYILHAPILKSDKTDAFGLKNLKDYGWRGNSDMNKLERELLKVSTIQMFCFIKSSSIQGTLDQMMLGKGNWCVEHPRAILKQDFDVKIFESGKVEITNSETRMECLFRHMRNSIAHNHIYVFDNGNILFEDIDSQSKAITARILLTKETVLNWISVVKKEQVVKNPSDDTIKNEFLVTTEITTKSA